MIRIFETGDIHIGKKFESFPKIKKELVETRFRVLQRMIETAEKENCDFFVIAGDLFDNVRSITQKDAERTANILAQFSERVLILPGNHDYFNEEVRVWDDFFRFISAKDNSVTLMNRFEPYEFDVRGEKVIFYPAYCQSKHSKENNLDWIRKTDINPDCINIGAAHGAIEGVTPDKNQEYFLMTQNELNAVPVDVWLIGHTHIPFPTVMTDLKEHKGYKVFNAGTHAQTDFHNNTAGYAFVIDIENSNNMKSVSAKAIRTGEIRFYDLDLELHGKSDSEMDELIAAKTTDLDDESVVRLNLSGTVHQNEYETRNAIYEDHLSRFLDYKIDDHNLSEEITVEKIRSEYAETSFAAKFMEALADDPKEMTMAYELLKECKE